MRLNSPMVTVVAWMMIGALLLAAGVGAAWMIDTFEAAHLQFVAEILKGSK